MAEGLVEGILGGEGESEGAALEHPAPDAFAAAIAHDAAKGDPVVADRAARFLEAQTRLTDTQEQRVHAEHAQFEHERGPRLLSVRLQVAVRIMAAVVFLGVTSGLVWMAYSAMHSGALLIEPFEVLPGLEAEVGTGRQLAVGLQDHLAHLQYRTRARATSKKEIGSAWDQQATITVPETGLSLSQIEEFLHTQLGHDIHIGGSIRRDASDTVVLTVRGSGIPPASFTGPRESLDRMLADAAEYLFGEAQPELLLNYLRDTGQHQRVIDFVQEHLSRAEGVERSDLLEAWALSLADRDGRSALPMAIALVREQARLDPSDSPIPNQVFLLAAQGEEETAAQLTLPSGRPFKQSWQSASLFKSWQSELRTWQRNMRDSEGEGTFTGGHPGFIVAEIDAYTHDLEAARRELQLTPRLASSARYDAPISAAVEAMVADEQGDGMLAVSYWDKALVPRDFDVWLNAGSQSFYPLVCQAAVDYQRAGLAAKADAAFEATRQVMGTDRYVDCYAARGDVADLRGDWPGAEAWYRKAVALAPSLPTGYYAWGAALLRHGKAEEAIAQLRMAHDKGPDWAEPLKAWGDALMALHRPAEARQKYDAALPFAPQWQALIAARRAAGSTG